MSKRVQTRLFLDEFAYYQVRYTWTDVYGSTVHDYYTHSIMYNGNDAMIYLSIGFAVLFVFIGFFGFIHGWVPSGQTTVKYAKGTIVLGLLVVVLSIIAGLVISLTWTSQVASGYEPYSWSLSTDFYSFLIGGFLFVLIGFIGTRRTRLAQVPPPPPLLPPPPGTG
jgi:hypothetical protein